MDQNALAAWARPGPRWQSSQLDLRKLNMEEEWKEPGRKGNGRGRKETRGRERRTEEEFASLVLGG